MKIIKTSEDQPKPTLEDIKALKKFTNLSVSKTSNDDWYCLTRKSQGSFRKLLNSGYCLLQTDTTPTDENQDSDYNYVLNFDENTFDFYSNNKLTKSFSFNKLPNWPYDPENDDFIEMLANESEKASEAKKRGEVFIPWFLR